MPTSSATYNDLSVLALLLHQWSEGLAQWERRLEVRTLPAAVALRSYRFGIERQEGFLRLRAVAFQRADSGHRLSVMHERAVAVLLTSAVENHGKRAGLRRSLATHPERRYLRADGRGDGQVVEVLGDLPSAEHVVFLVPGMTNELANFDTQLRVRALRFLDELHRQSPKAKVAVVAWLGYDTPDLDVRGLLQARESGRAKQGAVSLRKDLAEIRRLNPAAHLTAVGHSYGSVVLGQAMRHGLDGAGVSDVVVVGSPGMDANRRRDLGSPRIALWASKAAVRVGPAVSVPMPFPLPRIRFPGPVAVDPISLAPAHGEDPSAKGYGARQFSSKGAMSHGAYFNPGSESLRNMANIALGRRERVTH